MKRIRSIFLSVPPDVLGGILAMIAILLLTLAFNALSSSSWNGGVCPDCDTRYMLYGVRNNFSQYVCSECGDKVTRFMEW